jgi:hypothetical protein
MLEVLESFAYDTSIVMSVIQDPTGGDASQDASRELWRPSYQYKDTWFVIEGQQMGRHSVNLALCFPVDVETEDAAAENFCMVEEVFLRHLPYSTT